MKRLRTDLWLLLGLLLDLAATNIYAQSTAYAAYVHTTNSCNVSGPRTHLNQADINNNPNAHIQVTPVYSTTHRAVVAVEYVGGWWNIINEDNTAMPTGISFNIVVINDFVPTGSTPILTKFVQQITANQSTSNIPNTIANNNASNLLFLTNNRSTTSANIINNRRTQVLWDFTNRRFFLQNDATPDGGKSFLPLTLNARYNVLAMQRGVTYKAQAIAGNGEIDAVATDIVLVQRSQGDEFDSPSLVQPLSVRYDAAARKWRVYEGTQIASVNRGIYVAVFAPNRPGQIEQNPASPSKLSAMVNSHTQITLSWGGASGNEDAYDIEYALNSNFNPIIGKTITVDAKTTSQSFTELLPSTRYFFRVRSVNQSINSCFSGYSTIDATTQAPPVTIPKIPTSLTATATSSTQINLSWTDNANDETGFDIEQSTNGSNFSALTSTNANTTIHQHTGLTASTRYWYRVRAKNNAGASAWSNIADATTQAPPVTIPKVPTSLTATATSSTQINLSWTDNANDETGFDIEQSTDGSNFSALTSTNANTTTHQHTGLTASTRYWYRVRAKNNAGASAWSNIADATTSLSQDLIAPINLTANPFPINQIMLNWDYRSTAGDGFELWRAIGQDDAYTLVAETPIASRTFTEQNLRQQTIYFYKVRAKQGNSFSGFSNTVRTLMPVVTSVSSTTPEYSIEIFPNPAADFITVRFKQPTIGRLEIVDYNGKVALQTQIESPERELFLFLNKLTSGKYWLRIYNHQHTIQQSIIKF